MPIDFHVRLPEALTRNLNFFRIHLTVFTLTPLIFACIFYGANGSATGNANSTNVGVQKVEFVDSLFLCFSAMTWVLDCHTSAGSSLCRVDGSLICFADAVISVTGLVTVK
jgi:hypothetical protein